MELQRTSKGLGEIDEQFEELKSCTRHLVVSMVAS